MDTLPIYLLFLGLFVLGVGVLWLIVAAFLQGILWGLAVAVFFPVAAPLFVVRHRPPSQRPLVMMFLGAVVTGLPYALAFSERFVSLGERERVVDGEVHLTLTGWDRKDYGVLKNKPGAVVLQMANPDVTDATLEGLRGMSGLRELDLNDTAVTDAGLAVLKGLPALETLKLRNTRVSDAGFREQLLPLEGLRQLDLRGTGVAPETVKEWRAAKDGRRALR